MKKVVKLNKKQKYFLDGKFFLVKHGKFISREILESGKIISHEGCLKAGDVIGDFFKFLPDTKTMIPETEIEIEALEDKCEIEEFNLKSEILQDERLQKVICQLLKRNVIKFFYQLYDTKGYILAVLKLNADSNGKVKKSEINYEQFNISKSQFYLLYSKLKEEKFLLEEKKNIYLNISKINEYLEKNCM